MFPNRMLSSIPTISKDQMIEVDRVMVDDLGIGLVQMMENAGRNLARFTMEAYIVNHRADRVTVLAGSGGNGGGGLVAARRLAGWDVPVSVWLSRPPDQYRGVIAHQLQALMHVGISVEAEGAPPARSGDSSVVLDCLVGYSLTGAPRGRVSELIRWIGDSGASVVSLDIPSGVDATTGDIHDPAVVADATLTLALPKAGLVVAHAAQNVGDLYVTDIGVPAQLYRTSFGIEVGDLFATSDIVRVQD
ncbi:MAG: NAD(P)H-hydrate epimerase [Actinomycetota bacterium]